MAQIHPSSLVDPQAKLAENVVVGPFCTIGPHVEVGEGTTLQSHIVLTGHTKIGKSNKIYAFAAIGIDPQDKKYRGEETQLIMVTTTLFANTAHSLSGPCRTKE